MSLLEQDPILRQAESQKSTKERPSLTPRQIEVLELVAVGKTNREIGRELKIALQTVKNHLVSRREYGLYSGIYEILEVQSRTTAVIEAIREGFISLEEIKIEIKKPKGIPEEKLRLTQLELDILILTARGYTNNQIGRKLNRNPQTIKNDFSRRFMAKKFPSGIFEKLGVPSRTAAVARALQLGLITLDQIYEKPTFPSHETPRGFGEVVYW